MFAIAALGVGFMAGLTGTTPDMKLSMDRYFDQSRMMDLFVKGTFGLTAGDAAAVRALPGVDQVLPGYVTDAMVVTSAEEKIVARIYGLPLETMEEESFVNRLEILEGRRPEGPEECLVLQGSFVPLGLGARLTLAENPGETYGVRAFTVVGVAGSPMYIASDREPSGLGNGRVGAVLYVPEASYILPVYTDLFITLKEARPLISFTPAYQKAVDKERAVIELLGADRAEIRRNEIITGAGGLTEGELLRAEAEYLRSQARAEQELGEARQRLDAGALALAGGEGDLAQRSQELARGRADLEAQRRAVLEALARGEAELRQGEREIAEAKETLGAAKARLEESKPDIERARQMWIQTPKIREALAQYDAAWSAYTVGSLRVNVKDRELQQGWAEWSAGRDRALAEFQQAEKDLADGEAQIAEGRRVLAQTRQALADGEAEYDSRLRQARTALSQAREQLEMARKGLQEGRIPKPQWYVLDRNANIGCRYYKTNVEKIADLAKAFPVFFLLIALLVALTTMTRMIEEERIQIGLLKALGYPKSAILSKYLIYCGFTGIFGSLTGMMAGFQVLPALLYGAFGTMYRLPPLVTDFDFVFGLGACGFIVIATMAATVHACYSTLWEKPALLLVPRPPRSGKRIFLEYFPGLWNRMPFTYKVTARNLLRQKKHFFMTVTGIAGCTALMVAGFGLRDSMVNIAETQFEEILQYDFQFDLTEPGLSGALSGPWARKLPAHTEPGYLVGGKDRLGIEMIVPQKPEELPNFITLRDRKTKRPLLFSDTQVILTEKIAEEFNLRPGDSFTLENGEGIRGAFKLSGVTENYAGVPVYLGPRAYTEGFGKDLRYSTVFAVTGLSDPLEQDRFLEALLAQEGVSGGTFTARTQRAYGNLLKSISFVVLALIFAAGGLAMIVLYNLTNINIRERTREIATLRVLGFHRGEAANYLFREMGLLSFFGAGAGLGLGIPLHRFIIGVAENPDLMFGRTIAPVSFVLSGAITLLFSAGVAFFMLKKLGRITLGDSMKAPD
jgi:putative ABC transport system permease protein